MLRRVIGPLVNHQCSRWRLFFQHFDAFQYRRARARVQRPLSVSAQSCQTSGVMNTAPGLNTNYQSAAPDPVPDGESDDRTSGSTWPTTPLGRVLATHERQLLKSVMPSMYQAVCIQIDGLEGDSVLDLTTGGVSFYVSEEKTVGVGSAAHVLARPASLPFAARSVDLVVLSHVLEFSDHPHEILREVEQILAPGGHIVLIGFNPLSLWGLRLLLSRLTRRSGSRPWRGSWLTLSRIRDWVRLLGLESTGGRIGVYGLPIQSERLNQRFAFMDTMGARWWPGIGAVYAVVVMKREMTATPIKHEFRRKARLRPGLVTPMSPRRSNHQR